MEKLKLNPFITIKSYFFEGCKQAVEATKANIIFIRTLFLLLTLPVWYPFAFVIAHLAWSGYQKLVIKAQAEQTKRLFSQTQRVKNTEQQNQDDSTDRLT